VGYRRGDLIFALHVGDGTRPWTAEFDLDILFRSVGEAPPEASTRRLDLEPDEAVIARRAR
jgi:hypothetical protein